MLYECIIICYFSVGSIWGCLQFMNIIEPCYYGCPCAPPLPLIAFYTGAHYLRIHCSTRLASGASPCLPGSCTCLLKFMYLTNRILSDLTIIQKENRKDRAKQIRDAYTDEKERERHMMSVFSVPKPCVTSGETGTNMFTLDKTPTADQGNSSNLVWWTSEFIGVIYRNMLTQK